MTGPDFKAVLRRLGRTQIGFAQEIGISRRGVHRWAENGPPEHIVYLLALLAKTDLVAPLDRLVDVGPGAVLDEMFSRAKENGSRAELIHAVELWLKDHGTA